MCRGWDLGPCIMPMSRNQKVTRFNPIAVASFFCRASVLMNSLEIGPGSPPRASRMSSLSGLPGGCSPQIALARARKSDRGAALAGTTLAMTLSVRHQSSNLSAQQTPDAGEP